MSVRRPFKLGGNVKIHVQHDCNRVIASFCNSWMHCAISLDFIYNAFHHSSDGLGGGGEMGHASHETFQPHYGHSRAEH